VALQAGINNLYVTVDAASGGRLVANRSAVGTTEKFRRLTQSNGTVALQAVTNNRYVSADLNIAGVLIANRAAPSTWEQFTFTGL